MHKATTKKIIERQQDAACGGLLAGRPVKLCVPAACSSRLLSLHPACRAHQKRQHAQGNNGKNYLLLLGPAHVTKKKLIERRQDAACGGIACRPPR
jgi:hypothetical protein